MFPAVASEAGGHSDPAAPVVLALALFLTLAKVGGHLAMRFKQPSVLGELMVGVALGNVTLLVEAVTGHPLPYFTALGADVHLDMLSRLGVIILLFEVGLESTVAQMLQVGVSALLVASLGVLTPFALGWAVAA